MSRATRLPPIDIYTDHRIGESVRSGVNAITHRGNQDPWNGSTVTSAITFTAGQAKDVVHGLNLDAGQTPARWAVEDVTGGYSSFQRLGWNNKIATMQSENACTVVFRFGVD